MLIYRTSNSFYPSAQNRLRQSAGAGANSCLPIGIWTWEKAKIIYDIMRHNRQCLLKELAIVLIGGKYWKYVEFAKLGNQNPRWFLGSYRIPTQRYSDNRINASPAIVNKNTSVNINNCVKELFGYTKIIGIEMTLRKSERETKNNVNLKSPSGSRPILSVSFNALFICEEGKPPSTSIPFILFFPSWVNFPLNFSARDLALVSKKIKIGTSTDRKPRGSNQLTSSEDFQVVRNLASSREARSFSLNSI